MLGRRRCSSPERAQERWLRTPGSLILSVRMRRCGSRAPIRRRRSPRSALLVMLAALIALPAFAVASHKSSPRIPACSALSRGAIANLVGTGPLTLEKKTGNLCTFAGKIPMHYKPVLTIQIVPWSKKLFSVAERDAVQSAAREHEQFGVVSKALKVGKKAFFVTGTRTSASLPPCGSEESAGAGAAGSSHRPDLCRRALAHARHCGRVRSLARRRRVDGVSRRRRSAGRHLLDTRDRPGQGPDLRQDPLSRAGS